MSVIDDYLAKVASPQKEDLERVCMVIQKTVPEATETISYGMPAFKYKGKYLIAFAPFKDHMSIFPGSEAISTLLKKLESYKVSKGTVQFTHDMGLPESLLKEIIALRVDAIEREK